MQVCFQLACTTYTDAWVNPSLFYPLSALPEILAVIILSWQSLITILTHGRVGFGSTLAGPAAAVNPAAGVGPQVQTNQHSGYGNAQLQTAAQTEQPLGGGFFPGSQGITPQPYWQGGQGQDHEAQAYQNQGQGQGYSQEPYQYQYQDQGLSQGYSDLQRPYRQQPALAYGDRNHVPQAQRVQHNHRSTDQAQQQRHPQQVYPQQPLGAFSQRSLPFQQDRIFNQAIRLPFQPASLPSEPAPVAYQQSALYQPYQSSCGQQPQYIVSP